MRRGLIEILNLELQELDCGEAENGDQVLSQVQSQHWDLVILDVTMPGRSGIEVLADLKRTHPDLPVLVLSTHLEDQYGKRLLKAGASGYLNKTSAPGELLRAVRKVLAGGRYVSEALAERIAAELYRDQGQPLHTTLSDREFEVLRLIASGRTLTQIADELHLSAATISTYRARILEKMNMTTNAELMHYAFKNHLVE